MRVSLFRRIENELFRLRCRTDELEYQRDMVREAMTPSELMAIETVHLADYYGGPEEQTTLETGSDKIPPLFVEGQK